MPNVASRKGPVTLIITGKRLKNKKKFVYLYDCFKIEYR